MFVQNVLFLPPFAKEFCLGSPRDPGLPLTPSAPEAPLVRPEADLVAACLAGRAGAFENLFTLHGPRMKSIALNLLGNTADAEDVVQEAFLKIHRSLPAFRGQSAFSTWIYRILVNSCYDFRRRRLRRPEGTEMELDPETNDRVLPPAPGSDHPLRLALERAVAQLSENYRSVFVLYEVEGFAHAEIARMLGITEGASKNRLFEAKRELRRILTAARLAPKSANA